jgi:hypothetical protein
LWGEVDKVGTELFWCDGGAKLPSEVVINGNMDKPFFLLSFDKSVANESMPNLHAVSIDESIDNSTTLKEAYCLYNQRIVELCKNGNRTKELSFFEQILHKYNINVNR